MPTVPTIHPLPTIAGMTANFQPADPDFAKRIAHIITQQPLMQVLNLQLVKALPGDITIRVQHNKNLCQHHGYLHGGITALLADEVFGLSALSLVAVNQSVVTTDLSINYMRPGVGVAYEAHGYVIRPGKNLTTCRCEVRAYAEDGSSKDIAIAQASLMTLDHP